ncbi:MAG: antibiotic biosynthesis monooxygenase [Gordonia sp.]|jgi:quinol monooxygenase YgiN|nr:antibiotic biosynthesis monooxygenase [Gordonia sp. (in: high G+C Gram-positive bacteria)]
MSDLVPAELLASDSPVAFFGYAHAKQGLHQALLERMLALGEPSRREPGILAYEIHQDSSRPDAIAFYELYANGAAVRDHLEQPYMQEFFADRMSLLESDFEMSVLNPVRSASPEPA